jgi:hypothetical protein
MSNELRALIVMFALAAICLTSASQAVVILSTVFTARTISGDTADNITWTTNGVLDPGALTAVDVNATGSLAGLFDTPNSAGHFAPDLNTGNEGPWSVSLTLNLTVPTISLENAVLDYQHFNNSGAFQGVGRKVNWTVTVTGSLSGLLDSVTAVGANNQSGLETLVFPAALTLNNSESYTVTILAEGGAGDGNNTGLDGFTFNGSVPEPATMSLLALGGFALLRRRRF